MAEQVYLLEVPAWTGSQVDTLRFSTHSKSTESSDTPANTFYDGRIKDPGSFKRAIWENDATSGKAAVDFGYADLTNADGTLDDLIDYGWNRIATFRSLTTRGGPVAGATTLMRPIVLGVETPDALRTLRLRYRGRMAELDQPLLTRRYLGTTTSGDAAVQTEGDETLAGQIVPYAFGVNTSVPGKLISRFFFLYQFAANEQFSIVPMDGAIAISSIGDFGSPNALLNATVPAGSCATCKAQGMVKYGASPAFLPTANLIEGATAATRSAARVMQRIMAMVPTIVTGDIETATFDALHTFNPAVVTSYIDDDRTALDELSQVADSIGGALIETATGTYQAFYNNGPSASASATFTVRDLLDGQSIQLFAGPTSEGQGVPAYSVVINWGRIWKTMSPGDLAPRIATPETGADIALKQLLSNQYSSAPPARDLAVQAVFPKAVELVFNTRLTTLADAVAEAARRLALHKVRRDRVAFPTFFEDGDVALGSTVRIAMNRLGWNGGKNFLVIGRTDDFKNRRRVPLLWG